MNYFTYELAHMAMSPLRWGAEGLKMQLESPLNPFRDMLVPRMMAASCEVFENVTRRYGKPDWGIKDTKVYGMTVPVKEEVVYRKPFCNLIHFERDRAVNTFEVVISDLKQLTDLMRTIEQLHGVYSVERI